jgi:hypothetical protein
VDNGVCPVKKRNVEKSINKREHEYFNRGENKNNANASTGNIFTHCPAV